MSIVAPKVWYMAWNLCLLLAACALFYWLGPIVIVRGLSRWSAMQP